MTYHKNWPIPEVIQERAVTRYRADENGCWNTLYTLMKSGYGQITQRVTVDGARVTRIYLAHRASWVRKNGQIPDGLVIDHKCFNKSCVNPDHLRLLNRIQNNARKARDGIDWPLDQCRWGHPLSMQQMRGKTIRRRECMGCVKERNDWLTAIRIGIRLLEITYGLGDWHTKRSYAKAIAEREARVAAVAAEREEMAA